MVALFIFSIGILGIISLQLFAKQNNYDAIQRTTAAALAAGIVEKMRINTDGIGSYLSTSAPVPNTAMPISTTFGFNCLAAPGCSPAELAAHDLRMWHSLISGVTEKNGVVHAGGLTAPSACITRPTADSTEYRITIAWRGRSAITDPTIDTCGQDATDTDGNLVYGTGNKFRRIFVIDAKIE